MKKKYQKRKNQYVVAVQVNLETSGFEYNKWGGVQHCKAGDWLVNNNGDIYTVDKDVFVGTYEEFETGKFVKTTPIWAEKANKAGVVITKEGKMHYNEGDYLVSNNEDGTDAYAISEEKFLNMYEPVEGK